MIQHSKNVRACVQVEPTLTSRWIHIIEYQLATAAAVSSHIGRLQSLVPCLPSLLRLGLRPLGRHPPLAAEDPLAPSLQARRAGWRAHCRRPMRRGGGQNDRKESMDWKSLTTIGHTHGIHETSPSDNAHECIDQRHRLCICGGGRGGGGAARDYRLRGNLLEMFGLLQSGLEVRADNRCCGKRNARLYFFRSETCQTN